MKSKNKLHYKGYYEPGTPFCPFDRNDPRYLPSLRVMPSRFTYPVLPAACTFIRDLGTDEGIF